MVGALTNHLPPIIENLFMRIRLRCRQVLQMDKPTAKRLENLAYQWNEVVEWVQQQSGRDVRDWAGKYTDNRPDAPYQDFWHVICNGGGIHNGCFFWVSLNPNDYEEDFCKEIVSVIAKEFPECEGEMYCWVEW